ncbi:HAD-IC family P-type ATPase [Bacillus songklensis]|uniref:HAD-IC family P-type ATPase n=1 Tax=Bacillus songklensis TaxID=1069116 RepID=A0ABV8B442_9BACI
MAFKKRSCHVLPGRLRFELFGLKNNIEIAKKFELIFSSIEGVTYVRANWNTGKVLILFDEQRTSVAILTLYIKKVEEVLFKKQFEQLNEQNEIEAKEEHVYKEVAAMAEPTVNSSYFEVMPYAPKTQTDDERVPLPLALSVTGLGALGMKQLFVGRSALARHPLPFYASSFIAVSTGYPFIKRGLQKLERNKKLNIDLLFGASSLALALIRENLIVLAGISVLQFLNWKRKREHHDILDQPYVSPKVERYSKRMSRLGLAAAGISLAVSRNPLSALAILLAVNPRPVLTSTEYTWKQAEYMAKETKQYIPENGSIYQLSQTKAIVFDDASLIVSDGNVNQHCDTLFKSVKHGTKISILKNKKNVDIGLLAQYLQQQYNLHLAEIDDSFPRQREEVLFISKDLISEDKVVSYYPTVKLSKLPELIKSYQYAKEIDHMVENNLKITSIWNVAGAVIAAPLLVSAPVINLMADALTLSFLTKSKRRTEQYFAKDQQLQQKQPITSRHPNIAWHAINEQEVIRRLQSHTMNGLTNEQHQQALKTYGTNTLRPKERPHWLKSYLAQLKEFTTVILGTTAVLSMLTGHLFDGITMCSILLLNAGIGTLQERKAERAVETMTQFVPLSCHVVRDGGKVEIDAAQLVPGDIVELEAGDRIPADLRIVQAWNAEVDESALSGESLPVRKTASVVAEDESLSDRTNMLFMGTNMTRGKARAIVVQTGNSTEMGHLLALLNTEEDQETPLQKQVTSISKTFMKAALAAGVVVFAAGLLRGKPLSQMVTSALALTASAIPEGLPVTITVALTAGIFRMSKKKSLVRKLSALETLGRTTVICSDKTGTLTKNEMTVKKVATMSDEFTVSGDGYAPEGTIVHTDGKEISSKELDKLLKIGLLCSNTTLHYEHNRWDIKGDPTEGAIMTLAAKRNVRLDNHAHWTRMHEVPFDSSTGMMSVVCKDETNHKECYVMAKGSVEKMLQRCTHYQKNGKKLPLTSNMREKITAQNEAYANDSLRILAFAYRRIDHNEPCFENIDQELVYVGMAGMIDPPKADVELSIREAKRLGIKPFMITGDHPITAMAIAKQIGICNGSSKVITGHDLDKLSDEELENIMDDVCIFARVTPDHKLRIVTTLQKQGHVVTMTGDGVNDSPAIKKADVGVAMGQTGTQVTKETADIVLKEDHFGSIVEGVKEGRTIISNIRKALGCLLSGNLAEILVTSTAVIAGLPLPIVPIQILLMNLTTDALPAMVLAVNPGNKTSQEKRRSIADRTLYKQVVARGTLLGVGSLALFATSLAAGASLVVAQTTAFATLVAGQLVQTFSWRQTGSTETVRDWAKDRFLVGALGASWLALLGTIYISPLSAIFKTVPLPLMSWLPILAVAGSSAIVAKPVVRFLTRPTKQKALPASHLAAA